MRVLVVQTSPLGDIVDTLPALTDAKTALPHVVFDWVVEQTYQEVPTWHFGVERVITSRTHHWRKHFWQTLKSAEWRQFKTQLRQHHYDLVIDCQGLLKSAAIGKLVKAPVVGFEKAAIREPLAAWSYQRQVAMGGEGSRVQKMRSLFSQALSYSFSTTADADFSLSRLQFCGGLAETSNVVFLHSANREHKLYPERYWRILIEQTAVSGIRIRLPWGNQQDRDRAERLAAGFSHVEVLPRLNLQGMACVLVQATAVVAVDTGLARLGAALGVPTVSLYTFSESLRTTGEEANVTPLFPELKNDNNSQSSAVVPANVLAKLQACLAGQKQRREVG